MPERIDWTKRQWLALPDEMQVLERFATQPANHRSRKPARLIWLYTLGWSRKAILADLRVSNCLRPCRARHGWTLTRYFNCWIDDGVPGLTRMSHPELYRAQKEFAHAH
jgi:hypothetical protein